MSDQATGGYLAFTYCLVEIPNCCEHAVRISDDVPCRHPDRRSFEKTDGQRPLIVAFEVEYANLNHVRKIGGTYSHGNKVIRGQPVTQHDRKPNSRPFQAIGQRGQLRTHHGQDYR
jgi:hypothetical protein